jgi:hypothetical protein
MIGILSRRLSQVPREGPSATVMHRPRSETRRCRSCPVSVSCRVGWPVPRPGCASPANVSKRGLPAAALPGSPDAGHS